MSIFVLKLPDVKAEADGRPEKCPACGYDILLGWGETQPVLVAVDLGNGKYALLLSTWHNSPTNFVTNT
jgi:hypothetical protein